MARRTGRRLGSRPEAEQLEHRSLLAGNVLVAVNRGELDITGDYASNGVQVTPGPRLGQFTVTGLNDAAGFPTKINGVRFF